MRAKCLTVRAPWAQLIASGRKRLEIRKRWTSYRGPLLIAAGLKVGNLDTVRCVPPDELAAALDVGPRGVALCFVDVVGCKRVSELTEEERELACCAVSDDEFAWVLADPRPVPPTPISGKLGFFWVDLPTDAA